MTLGAHNAEGEKKFFGILPILPRLPILTSGLGTKKAS